MSSFANTDQPPTYQQVLTSSQEQLYQYSAPYNSSIPIVPMFQTIPIQLEDHPITMNCPYWSEFICAFFKIKRCQHTLTYFSRHTITTVIEEENSVLVFLLCILLALFGFICGCCLIPFCISDLKNKLHFCPQCKRLLGKKILL